MLYPEDVGNSLRHGQVEIYCFVDGVETLSQPLGQYHLLIKTYFQTNEEAGAMTGVNRKAMLCSMEGLGYEYNGEKGSYEKVGDCENAPREYALSTMLMLSPTEYVCYSGDWDYKEMLEKYENSRKCFPF
jgi:hypothetical protein